MVQWIRLDNFIRYQFPYLIISIKWSADRDWFNNLLVICFGLEKSLFETVDKRIDLKKRKIFDIIILKLIISTYKCSVNKIV